MTEDNTIKPSVLSPMTIKDKVDDEGIQARNLIKFNVPMRDKKKMQSLNELKTHMFLPKSDPDSPCAVVVDGIVSPQECGDVLLPNSRVPLMVTVGPNDLPKNICNKTGDYRARYWGQMMDTLKRTIDEIYSACETDESEVECKEVIMILEHSKKDFYSLIEKMNLFKEIENFTTENSTSTMISNKPACIAWDERKISPGKPIMKQVLEQTKRAHSHSGQSSSTMSQTETPLVTKDDPVSLDIEVCAHSEDIKPHISSSSSSVTQTCHESGSCTWADKVKRQIPLQKCDNKDNVSTKSSEKFSLLHHRDRMTNHKPVITRSHPAKSTSASKDAKIAKNDGEWETVCRSKFSQRLKVVKTSTKLFGQTLSDRPTRKSLSSKYTWRNQQSSARNQYFKRNKSKSENNLQLKDQCATQPMSCYQSDKIEPGFIKSYSSIVIMDEYDYSDRIINGAIGGRVTLSVNEIAVQARTSSSAQKKCWSTPQRKGKCSKTQSCTEISKTTLDKEESTQSKYGVCRSDDEYYADCVDSNGSNVVTGNDQLNTSLDNSTDEYGDDDETTTNIRQLNKKLADAETAETELQNELGRAQELEKACREQIEQEDAEECRENLEEYDTEVVECGDASGVGGDDGGGGNGSGDLVTESVERLNNECSENFVVEDSSDDGYDFVLNINVEKSNSLSISTHSTSMSSNKSLVPIEEIKGSIATQPQLDWSQINDEADSGNEWEDSIAKMRTPGRGVEMHQKLSAPSRKRSINSMQQLEEKQTKAKILREKLLLERTERVRELTKKVEEVRQHKCLLLEEKKIWMGQRLQKAEVKRQQQLDERVKKAHDEEIKGKEIAFIQSLEAAQKQFTIQAKHQESEARLHERQEERKKRMEEKAEREVAAETRRKKIETKRQAWLSELQQRWKTRDEELASKAENKERQRRDVMRAKEVEREQKKIVLEQQQKTHIEQLKEKILKKHEDSERRHHEQLAEISRKAFEMSVAKYSLEEAADAPPIETYMTKKWCNVCNVMIDSDVILQSHLSGKRHRGSVKELLSGDMFESDQIRKFNLEHIVDAPDDKADPKLQAKKERRKAVKKRIKKIKQRMIAQTPEFDKLVEQLHKNIPHTGNKQKYMKYINDIRRYLGIKDSGPWVSSRITSLEKVLCDLDRSIDVKKSENGQMTNDKILVIVTQVQSEQHSFLALGGLKMLSGIIELIQAQKSENNPILPEKTFKIAFKCVRKLSISNNNVCHYILYSNFIAILLDGLQTKLSFFIPDNYGTYLKNLNLPDRELPCNVVIEQILLTLTTIFDNFVTSVSADSIYTANLLRVSGDNSGRSSSQSNASSWTDSRIGLHQKIQDIISYVVSTGTIDKLSDYLCQVRGPLKENSATANFVLIVLSFLSSLLKVLAPSFSKSSIPVTRVQVESIKVDEPCNGDSFKKLSDRTQLLSSIEGTEMCGLVCLLYGLLLYQGNSDANNDNLPVLTGKITIAGLKLINNFAVLNLTSMQTVLSQEGTSLQLRHILSYLLFYCNERLNARTSGNPTSADISKKDSVAFSVPDLLHEVILCIGYFCVNNPENQNFVQTGQRPTILQQLCQLPFSYFSQRNLVQCLYPTLISCCHGNDENTAILELEMTCGLLSGFIEEKMVEIETSDGSSKGATINYDSRFELQTRFPRIHWNDAKQYFER